MIANDRAESESSLEVHRDDMRKYEYEFECNLLHMKSTKVLFVDVSLIRLILKLPLKPTLKLTLELTLKMKMMMCSC